MTRWLSRHAVTLALSSTSALIFYWLWPEIAYVTLGYNDAVSHYAMLRGMDQAWANGGHLTDFWMANINFGHAIFRSYQFLMHLFIWVMHKTLLRPMELHQAFNTCVVLVAMAMPWTFYKGWRIFGLTKFEAVIAAIVAVMIHEKEGYGIGLTNATFSGYGTVNQLFGAVLFPIAAGLIHKVIRNGRHIIGASIAYACVFMSHILTGYFLCLWVAIDLIFALTVEKRRLKEVWLPITKFAGFCLLWTAYWVIPMAQDGLLQRTSSYEAGYKWPGHGAAKMLNDYASGAILDDGRFPVLTILAALGLLYCLAAFFTKKKDPHTNVKKKLAVQTICWILLSFGPATFGILILWLPIASQVHWHRAFGITEIAFSLCAGVALAAFWNWLNPPLPKKAEESARNAARMNFVAGISLCVALLYPCLTERARYFFGVNVHWLKDTKEWWEVKPTNFPKALEYAVEHDDARYYAGHPWNYGNEIKISNTIQLYALLVQFNAQNVGSIHHHQGHAETLAYSADWKNPRHHELMNTRYVALRDKDSPPYDGWTNLFDLGGSALYDNGNKSGFFAVGRDSAGGCATNASLEKAIKSYLKSPLLDAHVYPRITLAKQCDEPPILVSALSDAERLLGKTPPPLPGTILESSKGPGPSSDTYKARVRMSEPGVLLFKMSYHPGWKALINGQAVKTHMALPAFTAIPLDKGEWSVELVYEMLPLKRALFWVSLLGALVTAATQIFARYRRGPAKIASQAPLGDTR